MTYKCGYWYVTWRVESVAVPELPTTIVAEVEGFVSVRDGMLSVVKNYAWNGASFFLFYWFGTPKTWKTPSLFHDAWYQLMREGQLPLSYRKHADRLFYRLLYDRLPRSKYLAWMPLGLGKVVAAVIATCAYW